MDIKQWVESITREWLDKLQQAAPSPKVLYMFCDSRADEAFQDDLIKLQRHGICCDRLFLDGETSSWLGMNRVECAGSGKVIAADEYAPAPIELPKQYDAIVIPEIDIDNAARAATGMRGTVKTELIYSALLLNKYVFVGEDSPGIKRADRRCLQVIELPESYRQLYQRHMNDLRGIGIECGPRNELPDRVIGKLSSGKGSIDASSNNAAVHLISSRLDHRQPDEWQQELKSELFTGKLLSAEWVRSRYQAGIRAISVRDGTLVSPLAADVLREKGMTVQFPEKG